MQKIVIIYLILLSYSAFSKEEVEVYTYHLKAPFIVSLENKDGLSFRVADLMSKYSKKFNYKLVYLPRKRLDQRTNKKVVLWSNPNWVKDSKEKKYLWSRDIVKDSDVLISNKNYKNNIEKVICVAGYVYPELNEYLKKHELKRFNVKAEYQVLSMISRLRAELGIMSYSTLMYHFTKQKELSSKINISNELGADFYRKFYFSKDSWEQYKDFEGLFKNKFFIRDLDNAFNKYGLKLERK